jgi:hypothetical protein
VRADEVVTREIVYSSSVLPKVRTTNEELSRTIAWADGLKVVWKIVSSSRSAPFGKNASTYLGFERGDSPAAVLARAHTMRELFILPDSIFAWRARFTITRYEDKGFRGGYFQQWDGAYYRGCLYLDYTPETREEVIDRFVFWCGGTFETRAVMIDNKLARGPRVIAAKEDGEMAKIRVTCRNNSDARTFPDLGRSASSKHNGGKLVIVTCEDSDLDAVKGALEESHAVASYEVEPA